MNGFPLKKNGGLLLRQNRRSFSEVKRLQGKTKSTFLLKKQLWDIYDDMCTWRNGGKESFGNIEFSQKETQIKRLHNPKVKGGRKEEVQGSHGLESLRTHLPG